MYHLHKTRSPKKPFGVTLVGDNGEPLSSHYLATKQKAWVNVAAQLKALGQEGSQRAYVQDDTLPSPTVYRITETGLRHIEPTIDPKPKYYPGRNPKKKKDLKN